MLNHLAIQPERGSTMTRQQVIRKQLIATGIVLLIALVIVAINLYSRSFARQVHLGKLVSIGFAMGGPPVFTWTDPEDLARIQAALPRLRPGAGYMPYMHGHTSMVAGLKDDHDTTVFLMLPTADDSLVIMSPQPPEFPKGNCWDMPEFLGVIGDIGMAPGKVAETQADPEIGRQFRFWAETFGKKSRA
jgi:hypothetical protein